ncbi:hypothetical protein LTR85_011888 [Meristemomyces frigidus]|nr:hypothetical protein LTR85_011888 [Meristemomyces frigidus]
MEARFLTIRITNSTPASIIMCNREFWFCPTGNHTWFAGVAKVDHRPAYQHLPDGSPNKVWAKRYFNRTPERCGWPNNVTIGDRKCRVCYRHRLAYEKWKKDKEERDRKDREGGGRRGGSIRAFLSRKSSRQSALKLKA